MKVFRIKFIANLFAVPMSSKSHVSMRQPSMCTPVTSPFHPKSSADVDSIRGNCNCYYVVGHAVADHCVRHLRISHHNWCNRNPRHQTVKENFNLAHCRNIHYWLDYKYLCARDPQQSSRR